jgi:predicted CopG family antitoxin
VISGEATLFPVNDVDDAVGTKQIRVSEDLYARVRSENTEDETLGETLERLVDDYTLIDFANNAAELDPDGSVREAVDGAAEAPDPDE